VDQLWAHHMNPDRLEQFLASKTNEINRGNFSEIVELEEENYNSEFTSKPSNDLVE
jgi:hypothetical protein